MIDDDVTAQVGLLLVTLHEQLVRAAEQTPVDMLGGLSFIIQTMLRKLHRKSVEGTFVQSRDKALHHLPRYEFEVGELLKLVLIYVFQGNAIRYLLMVMRCIRCEKCKWQM